MLNKPSILISESKRAHVVIDFYRIEIHNLVNRKWKALRIKQDKEGRKIE